MWCSIPTIRRFGSNPRPTKLLGAAPALPIADAAAVSPAWLLSLDCKWLRCEVEHGGGGWNVKNAVQPIVAGMSGSPILNDDGAAIGESINITPKQPGKRNSRSRGNDPELPPYARLSMPASSSVMPYRRIRRASVVRW